MVDYVEVSRVSHQLALDHGRSAHLYAARLAEKSRKEGCEEEAEFWRAVARALAPRSLPSDQS
jgi:ribosomal protein L18E